MKGLIWAVVLIVPSFACSKKEDPPPARRVAPKAAPVTKAPAPSQQLAADLAVLELAVYLPQAPPVDLEARVRALVKKHLPEFEFFGPQDKPPEKLEGRSLVGLLTPAIADYAPPDAQSLRYLSIGFSPEQGAALTKSQSAVVLGFSAPRASFRTDYPKAIALVAELAQALNGFPWDEGTRQAFTREAWKAQRMGAFDLIQHFSVRSYRVDGGARMVTLGLDRFGLPDLVANDVSPGFTHLMLQVINGVARRLYQNPTLRRPGVIVLDWDALIPADQRGELEGIRWGKGHRTELTLAEGVRDEGDAENRLIELSFGGGNAEARQIRKQALIREIVGYDGRIMDIRPGDKELEAAQKRALAAFLKLKPKFQKGFAVGEDLAVKAPFDTPDGGQEFMWVDVTKWSGDVVEGILMNTPRNIPKLSAGATVKVNERSVFDYLFSKPDGSQEGNETAAIIERMMR